MTLDEQLYELELQLIRRVQPGSCADLLSDDFVEFGSSGRTYNKEETVELLAAEPCDEVRVFDFKVQMFTPACALVTYRAVTRREGDGEFESLRSSVWVYRNGGWKMCFHQGTTVAGDQR